jgi:hypothetical protein
MSAARCPNCLSWVPVGAGRVGRPTPCPNCGERFRPAPPAESPPADEFPADPATDPDGLTPVLIGLALLPLGVPLAWVAARLTLPLVPIFSVVAPLAVAVGVGGLCVGVGLARGWSHAARVRWVLALTAAGYLAAAGLFLVQKDWAAAGRRLFGPGKISWKPFEPPDKVYRARVPGPAAATGDGPVPGWQLRAFTATAGQPDDRRGIWAVRFTLADGVPPGADKLDDDAWLARVRDAVVEATGGDLTHEAVVRVSGRPARELWLTLPDRVTGRVVRVVRRGDRLVYAAADGLFLSADAAEVRAFLDGLAVK